MKSILKLLCPFLLLSVLAIAQDNDENWIDHLKPLIGHTWVVNTQWANGQSFHQEVQYEPVLNNTIIKMHTWGSINQQTGEFGLRNEGIIARDAKSGKVRFWQFDIFGGITEGTFISKKDKIIFKYGYEIKGKPVKMRDVWERQNDHTWKYSVVQLKDEQVEKEYLNSVFKMKD